MSAQVIPMQRFQAGVQRADVTFAGAGEAHATAPVKLRLTRRGRLVFGFLAMLASAALLAGLAAIGSTQAVASSETGPKEAFHYVVMGEGASLWSLATELDPMADPRDLVSEIVQLNSLDTSSVLLGQAIAVPLRFSENPVTVPGEALGL